MEGIGGDPATATNSHLATPSPLPRLPGLRWQGVEERREGDNSHLQYMTPGPHLPATRPACLPPAPPLSSRHGCYVRERVFQLSLCWKQTVTARRLASGLGALHVRLLSSPPRGGGGIDLGATDGGENGKWRALQPPRPTRPLQQQRRQRRPLRRARTKRRRLLVPPRRSARGRGLRLGRADARARPRQR